MNATQFALKSFLLSELELDKQKGVAESIDIDPVYASVVHQLGIKDISKK